MEATIQEIRSLKKSLKPQIKPGQTGIIAVAVSKNNSENVFLQIRCRGTPVGSSFFDSVNDCYIVPGANFLFVGNLPFIFVLNSTEHDGWSVPVPVPLTLAKKHLPQFGLDNLEKFLHNYKEDYTISYLQFIQEN